ncbi:MAG: transketolase family protein [Patescibacteria group bacterium]|nr:transketolase family protein [Patescibacteria group bacterium]MDE1988301.1 transketolase family protein [Patescibacteria group bacterium]MDE2218653.1 transketolase family protein [Patescibacteria group bacterium]
MSNINPNAKLNKKLFQGDIEQIPTRFGYGEGLVIAGKENQNIMALCADLTDSTKTSEFKKVFPDRFVEMGITEQNMASLASGVAAVGKIPFISSYAMFSPGRNWEQIRTTICYNNQNVKIAGAHSGVSVGPDGATHQAIEDIAITRVIPNMVVIAPCDAIEAKKATVAAAKYKGPVYIRFTREKTPVMTTEETPFEIGEAEIYRWGKDVSIIVCGPLLYEALKAAEELAKEGVEAEVINNHTIKPMDKETILQSAQKTGCVVTIEEHQAAGGMGSAVSEILSQNHPAPMEIIGVKDRFGESGEPNELLKAFGLTAEKIEEAAKKVLKRK